MLPLLTAAGLVIPPPDLSVMSAAHARGLDGHQVKRVAEFVVPLPPLVRKGGCELSP